MRASRFRAAHVLFAVVTEQVAGPLRLYVPEWSSFDWRAAALSVLALLLAFRWSWSVLRILGLCAAGGLVLRLAL